MGPTCAAICCTVFAFVACSDDSAESEGAVDTTVDSSSATTASATTNTVTTNTVTTNTVTMGSTTTNAVTTTVTTGTSTTGGATTSGATTGAATTDGTTTGNTAASSMGTTNSGWIYRARVSSDAAGASVLAFHVARFRHSDEAEWRAAIELGRVLVNGRRVRPEQPLAAGDELEFHRAPWREPDAPESFTVAFEDAHVLVVVKPADLQVLPAGPFSARTLLALVRSSDASRREAAPAHRLGRGTSGLVAFGKTALGRSALNRQFRELTMGKTYLAWVGGTALPRAFAVRTPIARVAR